jgi:hypothetical protein
MVRLGWGSMVYWLLAMVLAAGWTVAAEAARKKPAIEAPMALTLAGERLIAEGRITETTATEFDKALALADGSVRVVLLSSSGGSVTGAVALGRKIRKAGLDVVVARQVKGVVTTKRAFCNSACPLVLAAGVERYVPTGSFIGVHQVKTSWTQDKIVYRETYRMVNGKKKIISRKVVSRTHDKSYTTVGLYKGLRKTLSTYLKDMGVSLELLTLMEKAKPSGIYGLKAGEMKRTRLVTGPADLAVLLAP